jgi:hypothetical protein
MFKQDTCKFLRFKSEQGFRVRKNREKGFGHTGLSDIVPNAPDSSLYTSKKH